MVYLLILPYRQQHQRTRIFRSYSFLFRQFAEFVIFGAGVEDEEG